MNRLLKKVKRSLAAMLIAVLVVSGSVIPAAAGILPNTETGVQFLPGREDAGVFLNDDVATASEQENCVETEESIEEAEAAETEESEISAEEPAYATDSDADLVSSDKQGKTALKETTQWYVGSYLSSDIEAPLISSTPHLAASGTYGLQSILQEEVTIPESYVSEGYLTTINSQGVDGTCWAFAYTEAAETDMLAESKTTESADELKYSTLGTAYYFYNIPQDPLGLIDTDDARNSILLSGKTYLSIGGNIQLTSMTMSGWYGQISNAQLPYNAQGKKAVKTKDFSEFPLCAVQTGAYYISNTQRDEIKKAIMKYGSVQVAYAACYGPEGNQVYVGRMNYCEGNSGQRDYYVYQDTDRLANHAVQIIGWDDSVSKNRFTTVEGMPLSDGAWLVRNSWGASWPENSSDIAHPGCFWLSYSDKSIEPTMVAVETEPASDYLNNYHYDASASQNTLTAAGEAVVFQAQHTEKLTAVNIGFQSTNVPYKVSVYVFDTKPGSPKGDTAAASKSGTTRAKGFYTVTLDESVTVRTGQYFSVVAEKNSEPATNTEFLVDGEDTSTFSGALSFYPDIRVGRGYYRTAGMTSYADLALEATNKSVPRLKAFTQKTEGVLDVTVSGDDVVGPEEELVLDITGDYDPADVIVTYARTENGDFSSEEPEETGIWWIKLEAPETEWQLETETKKKFTYYENENYYTVTWSADTGKFTDGSKTMTTPVGFGNIPYAPEEPARETDDRAEYFFEKWTPDLTAATGDVTYTAAYQTVIRKYPVTVAVGSEGYGTVDKTEIEAEYGSEISIKGRMLTVGSVTVTATPAETTAEYSFAFGRWTIPYATVQGSMTVTANFTRSANPYTLTFNSDGGSAVASITQGYGTAVTAPANPTKSGYTFRTWSPSLPSTMPAENRTFTAIYEKNSSGGGGGGGSSGGGGGGGSSGGGGGGTAGPQAASTSATFSKFWAAGADGAWRIYNKDQMVTSAWLCDDAIDANGQNVWYLMNTDGTMLAAGLVQDNTGNFYSLETTHNGYFGMLRYKNGVYDCNGQQIYLEFSNKHDGSFGAVTNAAGLAALKAIYGVTKFGIGNDRCMYTKTFE